MKKIYLVMVHDNTNGSTRVVAAYQNFKKARSCKEFFTNKYGNVDLYYWIIAMGISRYDYTERVKD